MGESACPGCGLVLDVFDGPKHDYLGASAACWRLYGELLADSYGRFNWPAVHKLMIDAYATQHPGVDERRARQSVGGHLIRICLQLERGREPAYASRMLSRATSGAIDFPWFEKPTPLGTITVREMLGAADVDEHTRLIRAWAADLWDAYSEQQAFVRSWCDRIEAGQIG